MEHLSSSISAHLEMSRGKFLKNGVAPEKESGNDERKPKSSNIQKLRDILIGPCLLKPGQTWREKLTFVVVEVVVRVLDVVGPFRKIYV